MYLNDNLIEAVVELLRSISKHNPHKDMSVRLVWRLEELLKKEVNDIEITNVEIFNMARAIRASGFPMEGEKVTPKQFSRDVEGIKLALAECKTFGLPLKESTNPHVQRAVRLGKAKRGSGHDCMLKGIIVTYNLTCNHVMLPQFMRYHFHDIVSSSSKMHRITSMNLSESCGKRVDPRQISVAQEYIDKYLVMCELYKEEPSEELKATLQEAYEDVMDNLPMGLELTMHVVTNYLQEKSIRGQRKGHKMSFWRDYNTIAGLEFYFFLELIGEL